jgi:hypothetical protein
MDVPLLEQVKIQAQALVPLVKAMRQELGEARANAIVRKALSDLYRTYASSGGKRNKAPISPRKWKRRSSGSRRAKPSTTRW